MVRGSSRSFDTGSQGKLLRLRRCLRQSFWVCTGLGTGHQHVQAWDNGLHVTPLGSGPLGWDSGQQIMQPQQLHHHHHVHPHAMHSQLPLKLCRRCNVQKPVSQFYKSKANSDGYDGRCKTCDAVQCAERRKRKQRVEVSAFYPRELHAAISHFNSTSSTHLKLLLRVHAGFFVWLIAFLLCDRPQL